MEKKKSQATLVSGDSYEMLKALKEKTGVSISALVESAIVDYFKPGKSFTTKRRKREIVVREIEETHTV